jgi:hypothetical protein
MMVAPITGGTAGTVTLPLFPAPFGGVTIKAAHVTFAGAVAANGGNYATMTLLNGGTAGTATTAIGTAGGTVGWSAAVPAAYSLNTAADELTEGQWLVAKYAVTGSVTAPGDMAVVVQYVNGKG